MVTYTLSGTIYRSTQFNRDEFRRVGLTSGAGKKEFSGSVDLTKTPLPQFPILINTPDVTQINFLVVQVTGGTVKVRLSQANQLYNNIDLNLSGTIIMSGIDLAQVTILSLEEGSAYVEVFGMGQ